MKLKFILILVLLLWMRNSHAQNYVFQSDKCIIAGVPLPLPTQIDIDTNYVLSKFISILGKDYKKYKTSYCKDKSIGNNLLITYKKLGIDLVTTLYHKKYRKDPRVVSIIFDFVINVQSKPEIEIMGKRITENSTFDDLYNDPFWKKYIKMTSLESKSSPDKSAIWFDDLTNYRGLILFKEDNGKYITSSVNIGFIFCNDISK